MTSLELLKKLYESGTAGKKLAPAFDHLRRDKAAAPAKVREVLERAGTNSTTLRKFDNLLADLPAEHGLEAEARRDEGLPKDLFPEDKAPAKGK